MASLATTDDLSFRIGDISDEVRAQALLDDVSAVVRAYTGQTFTLETTTDRLRARNGMVRLPQRPVTAVTTIADVDGGEVVFTWDAGDVVSLSGLDNSRSFEVFQFANRAPYVDATYTHGYETVPADIVAVVCQIAGRSYGRSSEASAVTQESIAGYSYSIGSAGAAGPMGMLADERRVLDLYRRPLGVIRVSA